MTTAVRIPAACRSLSSAEGRAHQLAALAASPLGLTLDAWRAKTDGAQLEPHAFEGNVGFLLRQKEIGWEARGGSDGVIVYCARGTEAAC